MQHSHALTDENNLATGKISSALKSNSDYQGEHNRKTEHEFFFLNSCSSALSLSPALPEVTVGDQGAEQLLLSCFFYHVLSCFSMSGYL